MSAISIGVREAPPLSTRSTAQLEDRKERLGRERMDEKCKRIGLAILFGVVGIASFATIILAQDIKPALYTAVVTETMSAVGLGWALCCARKGRLEAIRQELENIDLELQIRKK